MAVFRQKVYFTWRNYDTIFVCEYFQRQSYTAFTGLSIPAKIVRGERPRLRQNLTETDPPPSKTPISIQYSLVASQP